MRTTTRSCRRPRTRRRRTTKTTTRSSRRTRTIRRIWIRIWILDPDLDSESGSRRPLNPDPIWIRI